MINNPIRVIIIAAAALIIQGCSQKYITDDEQKSVKKIIQLYNNDNWEIRRESINKICSYNTPEAENLLLTALNDSHSSVIIEAINCIGIKTPASAKILIKEIAESDTDSNLKLYAIRSLGKYHDPTTAPVFAKGLASDDWLIREESVKGLLQINDIFIRKVSVPYIIKAINDERINVRLVAIENLNFRDEKLYKELANIVNDEENYNKIILLNTALKSLQGYLLDSKTRARLIEFLAHPNRGTRIISLNVLKKDRELQQY